MTAEDCVSGSWQPDHALVHVPHVKWQKTWCKLCTASVYAKSDPVTGCESHEYQEAIIPVDFSRAHSTMFICRGNPTRGSLVMPTASRIAS